MWFSERFSHLKEILGSWWRGLSVCWALVGAADVLIEHYGTEQVKTSWNHLWFLPRLGWKGWLIGFLFITLLFVIEGSYEYSRAAHAPDLWLGFDINISAYDGSLLCIQNRSGEPLFDVTVKIPERGGIVTSQTISRLEGDGLPNSCSVTRGQIREQLAVALLRPPYKKAENIPVRVTYTDLGGIRRNFDQLEMSLPFRESSFRRKSMSGKRS